MGKMKDFSIILELLHQANPIADPLCEVIEEEHLSLYAEHLYETNIIAPEELLVIDSVHFEEFWQDLLLNFDAYFLDNGIAVNTYECLDTYDVSTEIKVLVASQFQQDMIYKCKHEIQQRIDAAWIEHNKYTISN